MTRPNNNPGFSTGMQISIFTVAFLGWFFGGMQIAITNLAMRDAAIDLMNLTGMLDLTRFLELREKFPEHDQLTQWNGLAAQWYARYQVAFLFGAAAGGFLFGLLGDRIGRTRALSASIIFFSVFTGISYFAQSPLQLLVLRFVACLGIGGTWPNGVALVTEVWPKDSRPWVASSIGMAGNLGIFAMAKLGGSIGVTHDDWRWVMLVGAAPICLGVITWFFVRESPQWLASQTGDQSSSQSTNQSALAVFKPPYLGVTLTGIILATVPLLGGWGAMNWMVPWASEVGPQELKAQVIQYRAITSIVGSFFAGWIATMIGRRTSYFITSLGILLVAQYTFRFSSPDQASFLWCALVFGFFNGIYFGWLPFFLPELFPTAIRSRGSGVSFNFGRILTAATLLVTGETMMTVFGGEFARVGQVTSLVFLIGMVIILFAPDTTKGQLRD